MRRASAVMVVAALAVLGLVACGGDDDDDGGGDTAAQAPATTTAPAGGGGGGGSTVEFSTPPGSDLAYDQKDASTKAGSVTIDFDNRQATSHDVKIEDSSGQEIGGTDLVSSGTANATVDLQAGSYTFFCSVPGHREAGMEGTLTAN